MKNSLKFHYESLCYLVNDSFQEYKGLEYTDEQAVDRTIYDIKPGLKNVC